MGEGRGSEEKEEGGEEEQQQPALRPTTGLSASAPPLFRVCPRNFIKCVFRSFSVG
jgi:hypothetical protein